MLYKFLLMSIVSQSVGAGPYSSTVSTLGQNKTEKRRKTFAKQNKRKQCRTQLHQ